MAQTQEITLSVDYCEKDGKVLVLMTNEQRLDFTNGIQDDGMSEVSRERWKSAIAVDDRLRASAAYRRIVATFRKPTYMDSAEIVSSARKYDVVTNDYILLPERETVERAKRLFIAASTTNEPGITLDQMPMQLVSVFGVLLRPYLYLSAEVSDFLDQEVTNSVAETQTVPEPPTPA